MLAESFRESWNHRQSDVGFPLHHVTSPYQFRLSLPPERHKFFVWP